MRDQSMIRCLRILEKYLAWVLVFSSPGAANACPNFDLSWMMVMAPDGLYRSDILEHYLDFLANRRPGATVVLKGNIAHLKTEAELKSLFYDMKRVSPVLIALDQEGGQVQTITPSQGFFKIPAMDGVGKLNDTDLSYELAWHIGLRLRDYGVDWNMAPVVDLARPGNQAITKYHRGFAENPEIVAQQAYVFVQGLTDAGIISSLKHFPGHGQVMSDSHFGKVVVPTGKEAMIRSDWIPYLENAFVSPSIMTAHINFPMICGDEPASMSSCFINDILRGELGYRGVVFSDALRMQAITMSYSRVDAAIHALQSGNDMIMVDFDLAPKLADEVCVRARSDSHLATKLKLSQKRIAALKNRFHNKIPKASAITPPRTLEAVLNLLK